jgi:asparagine synthase (glutamine-hydrolysing)
VLDPTGRAPRESTLDIAITLHSWEVANLCGIAGLVAISSDVDLQGVAHRMAAALSHRGPDAEGLWVSSSSRVAFGHRRLSIIDLSPEGHQPMRSPLGRYVIAFNGEIYNHRELRARLMAEGSAPVWRGHSDTEVLLAGIEAWGFEMALARAIGMFAMALWDEETGSLFLARDRMGEKPLYYGDVSSGFAFASELKSIKVIAGRALSLEEGVVADFMRFGYVPGTASIYRGIYKLPPGHWLRFSRGEPREVPRPYWKLERSVVHRLRDELATANDEDLVDRVHAQLSEAVRLQMVSDVPLGAFLSGGVDSSAIVALMQAQSTSRVRTFTIGFHEKSFDEAPFAKAVAKHLGTDHTELYVSASDAVALIPDLPNIYDEPFADSSQIPTVLVSRMARRDVTVSLSGDGGDELFAGYPRYQATAQLARLMLRLPPRARRALAGALQLPTPSGWDRLFRILPRGVRRTVNGRRVHRAARLLGSSSVGETYVRLMSQWQPEEQLLRGVCATVGWGPEWSTREDSIHQMRLWDLAQYLPDDLLVKVDRASMSASLESRAPMLDHRVVELAFALPPHALIRGTQGKWVLRRVLERYVPTALFDRPKTGFAVPIAHWLRGPLREWGEALLSSPQMESRGLLDSVKVRAMWAEHLKGDFDRSSYLWNVLMFEAWVAANRH